MLNPTNSTWCNRDNNAFYETITLDELARLVKLAGLGSGCDMEQITPLWSQAESILEVGAGSGRIIDYLHKHAYQGTLTALERCSKFANHLRATYDIEIIQADILAERPLGDRKFDLILVLWSGIADFTAAEQPKVINHLASLLTETGSLVLDSMPANELPLNMDNSAEKTTYQQVLNDTTIHTYSMTVKDVEHHAQLAGLSNIQHIHYQTDTQRKRYLHLLTH